MARTTDWIATALAPAVWGSTYFVTTTWLPDAQPLTVAMLRALPAGVLLLVIVRQLPPAAWRWRVLVLGALNFSVFWAMLFVATYRLPGGIAATLGAVQPLIVIGLSRMWLGTPVRAAAVVAALAGVAGVGLLVLRPDAALDATGIAAALLGAVSMACGTVLSRRWAPPVPALTFTAWQLAAGGLLLLPLSLWLDPLPWQFSGANLAGLLYLGVIGAALSYLLWFRGIARLETAAVSSLALLSPVTAVALGWLLLDQTLNAWQLLGLAVVLGSVWVSVRTQQRPPSHPIPTTETAAHAAASAPPACATPDSLPARPAAAPWSRTRR